MHLGHRAIVIGVRDYVLQLFLVAFVAKLEDNLLRTHLFHEVSDHGSVLRDSFLVLITLSVIDPDVINSADCEYSLLEVLQFDHILGVG